MWLLAGALVPHHAELSTACLGAFIHGSWFPPEHLVQERGSLTYKTQLFRPNLRSNMRTVIPAVRLVTQLNLGKHGRVGGSWRLAPTRVNCGITVVSLSLSCFLFLSHILPCFVTAF